MIVDSELDVVVGIWISAWSETETCAAVDAEDAVDGAEVIGS